MAIYVLLQCCRCNEQKRLHLFSCSRNKDDVNYNLCKHFSIRYTYICKFGFFTLGWKIILEVKIQCKNCNSNYSFQSNTFNKSYHDYDNHHICCGNVFRINVSGYEYASDNSGLELQAKEDRRRGEEEKKNIEKIMKNQKEEAKKLKHSNSLDTDFIDTETEKLTNALDFEINNELNFDIGENIEKKNEVLKFCKFELH